MEAAGREKKKRAHMWGSDSKKLEGLELAVHNTNGFGVRQQYSFLSLSVNRDNILIHDVATLLLSFHRTVWMEKTPLKNLLSY